MTKFTENVFYCLLVAIFTGLLMVQVEIVRMHVEIRKDLKESREILDRRDSQK